MGREGGWPVQKEWGVVEDVTDAEVTGVEEVAGAEGVMGAVGVTGGRGSDGCRAEHGCRRTWAQPKGLRRVFGIVLSPSRHRLHAGRVKDRRPPANVDWVGRGPAEVESTVTNQVG